MKYSEVRELLRTGDVVLFNGKGLVSWIISRLGGKSHVGVIYRPNRETVLLYESTTLSNLRDVSSGRKVRGVQLVNFSRRVATYNGRIWVRRLDKPLDRQQRRIMEQTRKEFAGKGYEQSLWQLIRAGFKWSLQMADLGTIFCSELVAELFQRWGFLSRKIPANEHNPGDFRQGGCVDDFMTGNRLGIEIPITKG